MSPAVTEVFDTGVATTAGGTVTVQTLDNGRVRLTAGDDPFEFYDLTQLELDGVIAALRRARHQLYSDADKRR